MTDPVCIRCGGALVDTGILCPECRDRIDEMPDPTKLGSYRHHKGGTYTLLYVARNSEQREQRLAVYVSHQRRQVWVRPLGMFLEPVVWPDGVTRPRFDLLPDETPEAP